MMYFQMKTLLLLYILYACSIQCLDGHASRKRLLCGAEFFKVYRSCYVGKRNKNSVMEGSFMDKTKGKEKYGSCKFISITYFLQVYGVKVYKIPLLWQHTRNALSKFLKLIMCIIRLT